MPQKLNKLEYNEDLISEDLFGLIEEYSFDKSKFGELRNEKDLTKEQFHEALKIRFRIVYRSYPGQIKPSSRLKETAKRYYPGWCGDFGITPDPGFPGPNFPY